MARILKRKPSNIATNVGTRRRPVYGLPHGCRYVAPSRRRLATIYHGETMDVTKLVRKEEEIREYWNSRTELSANERTRHINMHINLLRNEHAS